MKCADIIRNSGFAFSPVGENAYRVVAPFSLGSDGQLASFYVAEPSPNTYYITDAGETMMVAEHLGIRLNKRRIDILNHTYSVTQAKIDGDGCITSSGNIDDLSDAIWDSIKLMMALFFKKEEWKPKFAQEKFRSVVFKELSSQLGAERVVRKARVKAASGNTVEFPIAVQGDNRNMIYVNPLALENGKFNWAMVYQLHGKFSDVQSISEIANRVSIIEICDDKKELGKVTNFLRQSSLVRTFNAQTDWKPFFA